MIDADDYATHCHKAKVAAQAVYEALINKEYGAAGVLLNAAEWELQYVRDWMRKNAESAR